MDIPFALIITGPTGSGKTDLALKVAECISSEIINADIGQFYTKFSVGTAKPDWKSSKIKHHLFDIINEPENYTVVQFRKIVLDKVKEIYGKGKLPIIVGGSLFYLKTLYYPTSDFSEINKSNLDIKKTKNLWGQLNEIDSDRASQIHPNDVYRISRALEIWRKTGRKPSLYLPKFSPEFNSVFVFLLPQKEVLRERINNRTVEMIQSGWIDEVETIIGTEWESFLQFKKFIGYSEIMAWLNSEKKDLKGLISNIQNKTWDYARRQIIFWRSFGKRLTEDSRSASYECRPLLVENNSEKTLKVIISQIDSKFSSL
ncbi:tRNA (adenosine(37)-N6)-dimethylallyltransferase MiaA [Candidatus Babeliales bacterium]|nr:tRNA (adenosine(37)-N6)-dimethylallyltransferase MiaA [Candidatus Babeliales bacterium]